MFEQAINIMGDTIEDTDKKWEQKGNRIQFLENKIGLPDCKVIEEMNRLGLNKKSSKRKGDRIMDWLYNSLTYHKYNKNKKRKNKNWDNDLLIETTS